MQINNFVCACVQTDPKQICRDLLRQLSCSLSSLFEAFDIEAFTPIVDRILQNTGAIFWTGVGKSGIVAEKISTTFSSCGFRSFHLHAQNGLHGDIGSILSGDIVFLLSKSGETQELLELLPALREKNVFTIAVVAAPSSRLAKGASTCFVLPALKELCPYDIAPTSSVLAQMIFGDLLAMTLMRMRPIDLHQFIQNHPAGKIGRRHLLRVSDIMLTGDKIPFCRMEDRLEKVLVELSKKQCGAVCVVDEQKILLGIFTDGDLRRSLEKHGKAALEKSMHDLMTKKPKTVSSSMRASDAMLYMEQDTAHPITVLPVVDQEKCVGIVRMHDIVCSGV